MTKPIRLRSEHVHSLIVGRVTIVAERSGMSWYLHHYYNDRRILIGHWSSADAESLCIGALDKIENEYVDSNDGINIKSLSYIFAMHALISNHLLSCRKAASENGSEEEIVISELSKSFGDALFRMYWMSKSFDQSDSEDDG